MITKFKIFENRSLPEQRNNDIELNNKLWLKEYENTSQIKQQPFYLRKSDFLYISDQLAHQIAPTPEQIKRRCTNKNYADYLIKQQEHFFNDTKTEAGNTVSSIFLFKNVTYKDMFRMDLSIHRRGNHYNTEFGNFYYYLTGNSGDHDMHGKNMIRATRECNLHFMEWLYPIIKDIKDFYKKFKNNDDFFGLIKNEIYKNPEIAKDGVPKELEEELGYIQAAYKYNL
jgi:hypothetical protein